MHAGLRGRRNECQVLDAQLFLSQRTVEWRLHKVFIELGISSRRELQAMPREARPSVEAA